MIDEVTPLTSAGVSLFGRDFPFGVGIVVDGAPATVLQATPQRVDFVPTQLACGPSHSVDVVNPVGLDASVTWTLAAPTLGSVGLLQGGDLELRGMGFQPGATVVVDGVWTSIVSLTGTKVRVTPPTPVACGSWARSRGGSP